MLVGATGLYDPSTGGRLRLLLLDLGRPGQLEPGQLLMEAELPWTYECGDGNPILYPLPARSPGDTSRNFETTAKRTYLYFTRFNYSNCVQTLDRDLIRIPIEFVP